MDIVGDIDEDIAGELTGDSAGDPGSKHILQL
jgi:hypothetical protein